MSEITLEAKKPCQEFLEWKEKTWRQGSGGPSGYFVFNNTPDPRYQYVSESQLREEFTKPKLQRLLDAVFAKSDKDAPDADTILEDYLRAFLILVSIGRGHLILNFLEQAGLKDHCLPFLTQPHKFPKSMEGVDLFAAFCKAQWRFCPVELKSNMRLDLCSDHILPLRYEKMLAAGGSAVTYKVRMDAEFNKLEHPNRRSWDTLEENRNIYVIKSYQTDEAQEYYENECSGFRKLKNATICKDIIGFYGNFTWDNTRNVILEYADRGTLEEYMRSTERPSRVKEFEQVWSNYFSLLHGLVTIHGKSEISGKKELMLGWHQDLTPKNILVKSGRTTRPYDCQFKIADLGLSHFERSVDEQDPTAKDSYGTFAYGPPEICRPDPDLQNWPLKIKQNVDIWAFGCISSEFATWVALGYNKVEEYREQRGIEFQRKTTKSGQCFHDLEGVLDAVDEVHKEICKNHGKTDRLTTKLAENIIQEILRANSEARPSAKYLYDKSSRTLNAEGQSTNIEASPSGPAFPQSPPFNTSLGWPAAQPRMLRFRDYDAPRNPNGNLGTPLRINHNNAEFYRETLLPLDNNYDSGNQLRPDDLQSSRRFLNIPNQAHDDSLPNGPAETVLRNGNPHLRQHYSQQSLFDALECKRRNETGEPLYNSYPHAKIVKMLKDRDHVFVIDLGKSMAKHRLLMANWLQILGYTAPGSLDVYCTGNFAKSKAKTYSDLTTLFHCSSFVEAPHPNVPKILASIFEDYQNKLGKRHFFRPIFGLMPNRGPRKMSIYVLTDGNWGRQNDLKTQIRSLVDGLWKYHMVDKQIGIQLLRFGNVAGGIKNLKELDSGLGLQLDLVDTEPAEGGDVFKAMLGPVDENYDDD